MDGDEQALWETGWDEWYQESVHRAHLNTAAGQPVPRAAAGAGGGLVGCQSSNTG